MECNLRRGGEWGHTFGWVRSTILGRRSKSDIPEIKKYTLFLQKYSKGAQVENILLGFFLH